MAEGSAEEDWKSKIAILFGIVVLLIIVWYICARSCPAGYTWDESQSCCVDIGGNCYVPPTPPAPPACGDGYCNTSAGEDCTTCATDCGTCPPPPPPPCIPAYASCNPMTDICCGGFDCNGAPTHCCPSGYTWNGVCCANPAGVCSCQWDGFFPCASNAECCSNNCDSSHCCPGGTVWDPVELCCKLPSGVCSCSGVGGSCPTPSCCDLTNVCTFNHCCPAGHIWNTTYSCCTSISTGACSCFGPGESCTVNDECCGAGSTCSLSHCCPSGTSWDPGDQCCKTPGPGGVCVASGGNWEWYCLSVPVGSPTPVCGDGTCTPGETCMSCSADCGACAPICGDGTCNGGETCVTCPGDCTSGCSCTPLPTCLNNGTATPWPTCNCDCTNAILCPGGEISLAIYNVQESTGSPQTPPEVRTYSQNFLAPPGVTQVTLRSFTFDDCGIIRLNGAVVYDNLFDCPVWDGFSCIGINLPVDIPITGVIPGANNQLEFEVTDTCGIYIGYRANLTSIDQLPPTNPDCSCGLCGDGTCDTGETCTNCPADCGACACVPPTICLNNGTAMPWPACICDCSTASACTPINSLYTFQHSELAAGWTWDTENFNAQPGATGEITALYLNDCGEVYLNGVKVYDTTDHGISCPGGADIWRYNIPLTPVAGSNELKFHYYSAAGTRSYYAEVTIQEDGGMNADCSCACELVSGACSIDSDCCSGKCSGTHCCMPNIPNPPEPCLSNSDCCGPDSYCEGGRCCGKTGESCTTAINCCAGWSCTSGICVP